MENHPLDRYLGIEHLNEMPCDRLALSIFISRQIQLVAVLDQLLQKPNVRPLVGVLHIQRFEPVINIDPGARPRLVLVGLRHLRGIARKVANVTDRRLNGVAGAKKLRDLLGLGRRFDNN